MKFKYTYSEHSEQGRFAFVPAERGRWIKTHLSVLHVACHNRHCKAAKRHPCISLDKLKQTDRRIYQVRVHPERMKAYKKFKLEQRRTDDQGKVLLKMRRRRSG